MKEMIYQANRTIEVLDSGEIDGYGYYILSLGTHPTAYINLPEGHPAERGVHDYEDVDIECHGCLTYGNETLNLPDGPIEGRFIGWDYAHCGDYMGYYSNKAFLEEKRWTTQEILEEVKDVIQQLKAMCKE